MSKNESKKTLHLFGGGSLIGVAEDIARKAGWRVVLRTGSRFLSSLKNLAEDTLIHYGDNLDDLLERGGMPEDGDIGFSVSAPWIFTQKTIEIFKHNLFNIHNQPLPKFRGGGGSSWQILMNERSAGVCIHRITSKVDVGEIYARVNFDIPNNLKYPFEFEDYVGIQAKEVMQNFLPKLLNGEALSPERSVGFESNSEYWPRLSTDVHGWINWAWGLNQIQLFCNAFSKPHPGAKTMLNGVEVRILKFSVKNLKNKFHPFQAGLIFRKNSEGLFIAHPDGVFILHEYLTEPEGLAVRLGDRLHTPIEKINDAMAARVQYLPSGELIKLGGQGVNS
jgi:methionyl-tRNA formyltransferase